MVGLLSHRPRCSRPFGRRPGKRRAPGFRTADSDPSHRVVPLHFGAAAPCPLHHTSKDQTHDADRPPIRGHGPTPGGNCRPHLVGTVAPPSRLSEPLPPLQLRQRDPHQHPTPRGDPGGRVSVVESRRPDRPSWREGHLDSGSDEVPNGEQGPGWIGRSIGAGIQIGTGVRHLTDRRRGSDPVVCRKLNDDGPCVWYDRLSAAAGRSATRSKERSCPRAAMATVLSISTGSGSKPATPRCNRSKRSPTSSPMRCSIGTRAIVGWPNWRRNRPLTWCAVAWALTPGSTASAMSPPGRWRGGGCGRAQGFGGQHPASCGNAPRIPRVRRVSRGRLGPPFAALVSSGCHPGCRHEIG